MKTNTQTYYPHINGLRALAVLSVIFFHLDFPIFQGGFVGVDVFFVISGFLIIGLWTNPEDFVRRKNKKRINVS